MKAVILLLTMLAVNCMASTVTVTGYGADPDSSLTAAKQQAVDRVAGTLLFTDTTVVDDSVRNTIKQYGGGFVTSYEVVSTDVVNGLIATTIVADVDSNKINMVAFSYKATVPSSVQSQMDNAQHSAETLDDAVQWLMEQPNKFAATITSVKYDVRGIDTVLTVYYDVKWSPKWYDDMLTVHRKLAPDNTSTAQTCYVGDRRVLVKQIDCYNVDGAVLDRQQNFSVLLRMADGNVINPVNVYVDINKLCYQKGRNVTMYKNGVVRDSVTVTVDTSIVKRAENLEVVAM